MEKAIMMDWKLSLQKAVNLTGCVHNTNVKCLSFSPVYIMIGKVTSLPCFTEGTRVTNTNVESEIVDRTLRAKWEAIVEFNKRNHQDRIKACANERNQIYNRRRHYVGKKFFLYK